jgi:NADH:ubiquinone oxidoreductase subunit K
MNELSIWISGCLILFIVGIYGLITQKDSFKLIISIEILVTAANSLFIGIGYYGNQNVAINQSYAILSLSIGGGIIAVALGFIILMYKRVGSIDISQFNRLRW